MIRFCTVATTLSLVAALACNNGESSERFSKTQPQASSATSSQIPKIIEFREQVLVTYRPAPPEYPPALKKSGIQGEIKLVLRLSKDGNIVQIEKETGPAEFLPYAESYARKMRFDVDQSCFSKMQTVPFRLTLQFKLPPKLSQ